MPKIIIREKDNTKAFSANEYENFSVAIAGFCSKTPDPQNPVFNSEGVYECSSLEEFIANVGEVNEIVTLSKGIEGDEFTHYGNKIARALLGLGYTVLYKNLGNVETSITTEVAEAAIASLESDAFWECFKDKGTYDFRYVMNGFLHAAKINGKALTNVKANNAISKLATFNEDYSLYEEDFPGRGDCVALVDVDESIYDTLQSGATTKALTNAVKTYTTELTSADKYTAIFTPAVCYSEETGKYPASFHYLACAKQAREKNFAEWFAIAGYTRGLSDKYIVSKTTVNLGELAVNALEPRKCDDSFIHAVNVIAKIRNNYYVWGNRTAHALNKTDLVASHFLNIRQLCTTIKKYAYVVCRQNTFDPNDEVLWLNIVGALSPLLDRMKANQGIEGYKLEKIKTNTKALLKAKLTIIPIEAVEDFEIFLTLEDAGGVVEAQATESVESK